MVVCKFFNQGYCRYGNHCRFEHVNHQSGGSRYVVNNTRSGEHYSQTYHTPSTNYSYQQTPTKSFTSPSFGQSTLTDKEIQQSVGQDIDDWTLGKIWSFSAYAPLKEGENFPDFDDISPEELRFYAYKFKSQGNSDNYTSEISNIEKDINNKRIALKKPNKDIMEVLRKLFRREKLTLSSSNVFRPSSPNAQMFGQTSAQADAFQFKLPSESNNIQGRNLFGGQNVFSSASPAATFSSGNAGLFGNPDHPAILPSTSLYGQNSFANIPTTQPTMFQAPPPINSANVDSKFSFRMENHPSVFGNNPSNATTPFVKSMNSMDFSLSNSDANNNVSKINSNFSLSLPNSSTGRHQDVKFTPYTSLTDLTAEEREQFEAQMFTLGRIPERPPPREAC